MTWRVEFRNTARAELRGLDRPERERIVRAIDLLAQNPHTSPNVVPMKGTDQFRLRVGDWRVIYALHDDVLTVLVIRVGHRRDAYRLPSIPTPGNAPAHAKFANRGNRAYRARPARRLRRAVFPVPLHPDRRRVFGVAVGNTRPRPVRTRERQPRRHGAGTGGACLDQGLAVSASGRGGGCHRPTPRGLSRRHGRTHRRNHRL